MIAEAIQHVEEQTRKALGVEVLNIPGAPAHVRYLRIGEKLEKIELDPGPRTLVLETVADLIALANNHFDADVAAGYEAGVKGGRMVCVYDAQRVVLTWDHTNGRESAIVPLRASAEMVFFLDRVANPSIQPKDLREALRYVLTDTMDPTALERLVKQVSNVVFQANEAGAVNLDRRGESMGATIARNVQMDAGLPDERQTFSVRPFRNPDLGARFPLTCILDPDHANRRFYLRPLENSLTALQQSAADFVGGLLRDGLKEAGVPVYQGSLSFAKP